MLPADSFYSADVNFCEITIKIVEPVLEKGGYIFRIFEGFGSGGCVVRRNIQRVILIEIRISVRAGKAKGHASAAGTSSERIENSARCV